jgi:hypothetical protein
MTKVDDALKEMLDANVSYDEVERRYSVGTRHRAHEKWRKIVSKETKKTNEKRRAAKRRAAEDVAKVAQYAQILQDNQASIDRLEEKEQTVLARLSSLEQHAVSIAENTANLEMEEKQVKASLEKLFEKGYDEENLERILNNDAQAPSELIQRIQTVNQFIELCEEKDRVENHVNTLVQQREKEETKLVNIQENTNSAQNELDQFNTENLLNQEALSVVHRCFELGFMTSILITLMNSLLRLSIKNEIISSSQRLINGLEKVKTIVDLEEAIIRNSSRLNAVKKELQATQGVLDAKKKDVLRVITGVEKQATQSIEQVASDAKTSTLHLVTAVKNVETQSIASIINLEKVIKARLSAQEQAVSAFFINNSYAVKLAIDMYGTKVIEYSDFKEEMGELRPWMDLASILFGTIQDPQQLQRVNLPVLRRIAEGIHLYVAMRWSSETIQASREISDNDFGVFTGSTINLVSASALLVEGLKKLERQGKI